MATQKSEQLLVNFKGDSLNSVSRNTVKDMVAFLGLTTETQVIHYALSRLAREVLPSYEPDNGDLTATQIATIKKAVPQNSFKSVSSSLFTK